MTNFTSRAAMGLSDDEYTEMGQKLFQLPAPTWAQYFQLEGQLAALKDQMVHVEHRLEMGATRFTDMERKQDTHCNDIRQLRVTVEAHNSHVQEMKQLLEDIKAVLVIFESAKGTVTVLSAIGSISKWIAAVAGAGIIFWAALKNGMLG